ncbi:Prephenate dehydratase [Beutenbergia cavernae DSM 12333]|uniref:Prephenate dehydratase n=1 Tax=Beutenbergia cavernae (strain ATCC BAA-8 / DSM 12333 / CCUG 43141 / JCM 11478 / NBRC 16432 / NCIMB 13614 / HKI 0122) TaxID=471853 RepID=C5BWI3_BEUC1|nr:prephenate dehydratase [Beutenbergia cavernae]ACQ78641.1 Prephenate dehydratase [Beutenbergia cavernae DSM 12333]
MQDAAAGSIAGSGRPRYAYLGPPGTFTEAALHQVASPDTADFLPRGDVVAAVDAVRTGDADFAVVPIENSVEGGVSATLDTLAAGGGLVVVGEALVPISFVLAALPGTRLSDVRRISTHPHAWAQCRRSVAALTPGAVHVPATSTAAAAARLAEVAAERAGVHEAAEALGFDAVLVAPHSARSYGLEVLAADVGDNPSAVTRFVVVGRPGRIPPRTGADKTTLMVQLPDNEAGALLTMLEQFATRGVNLSRIESRPIGDELGRYAFSIDAEGHLEDERVAATLMGLHRVCPLVLFLGSYPRADGARTQVHRGTSDAEFAAARGWVEGLRGDGAPA